VFKKVLSRPLTEHCNFASVNFGAGERLIMGITRDRQVPVHWSDLVTGQVGYGGKTSIFSFTPTGGNTWNPPPHNWWLLRLRLLHCPGHWWWRPWEGL